MENLKEEFNTAYLELHMHTKKKEEFEYEYEMEKCRMLFSAEVQGLGNQSQRDAQARILLDEKGLEKKMSDLRTNAKIAWYKWETLRTLLNNE
jgi:hypothetical protein